MSDSESRPPASDVDRAILFNAKEIGLSLLEVAVDIVKQDNGEIESRWLHSTKDADLFIWKDKNKNIIKQQMTFFGQLIEWNVMEGVRTGLIIEDDSSQKMGASPLIQYDTTPLQHGVEQGIDIISYIPALTGEDKLKIIENFVKSPQFGELDAFEVIQKYGQRSESKTEGSFRLKWLSSMLKCLGLSNKKK